MHTFLHKKFNLNFKYITQKNRLLIALSGGQDSICLTQLTHECFMNKFCIEAIYIDYQWKSNSYKHTQHIINLMNQFLIPISIYQTKKKYISENQARQSRYKLIIKHAKHYKFTTIMTGHNKDDKIETCIYNIIRGSSINGLTNFKNLKKINHRISIIRPLLNFSKTEIAWFCRKFYLPIWSDTTNLNNNIRRNRIRYELLPYLQNHFNPQIKNSINRFIELCQEDNEYIKENTIRLYINSKHKKWISLNLKLINQQHITLQKRVLQLYLYYNFNKIICSRDIPLIITNLNNNISLDTLTIEHKNGWIYAFCKKRLNFKDKFSHY